MYKTNVIDSLSYRAFGSASQVVYGNDRKLDLTYNAGLYQLTNMSLTRWDSSEKIVENNYYYTDNGLIYQNNNAVDPTYNQQYAYNYRNQLTTVYGANYSQSGYSFDNFGNLLNGMTFPKIGTSDTPVNNRPSSFNNGSATINFTFDNSGNMTAAGATTY